MRRGAGGIAVLRILAAADAYHAMREDRPHRAALSKGQAGLALRDDVRAGVLDGRAAELVLEAAGHTTRGAHAQPGGLTPRELDVLKEVARGRSNKEAAAALGIQPRTVKHHVARIYEKTELCSRAGMALFAIEHGLMPAS